MRTELRCIHTLNGCNAIAEITCMRNKQRIFEHISSFSQVAEKEISAGIFGAFIITQDHPAIYNCSIHSPVPVLKPACLSCVHIPYPGQPAVLFLLLFCHPLLIASPSFTGVIPGPRSVFFSTNNFFTSFSGVEAVVILSRSSKYCQ